MPRAAVAVVVVSLMILGLTNVVLNTYSLTTGPGSKDVEREVNLAEPGRNDTENESESERWEKISLISAFCSLGAGKKEIK